MNIMATTVLMHDFSKETIRHHEKENLYYAGFYDIGIYLSRATLDSIKEWYKKDCEKYRLEYDENISTTELWKYESNSEFPLSVRYFYNPKTGQYARGGWGRGSRAWFDKFYEKRPSNFPIDELEIETIINKIYRNEISVNKAIKESEIPLNWIFTN